MRPSTLQWSGGLLLGSTVERRRSDPRGRTANERAPPLPQRRPQSMSTPAGARCSRTSIGFPLTVGTEAWPPNVGVADGRLRPPGVRIVQTGNTPALPFRAGCFELVLNRHGTRSSGLSGGRSSSDGCALLSGLEPETNTLVVLVDVADHDLRDPLDGARAGSLSKTDEVELGITQ